METILARELLIVEILLVVSLVAVLARRLRLPYTVALVLAGLGVALHGQLQLEMTPELVLAVFLPPLVFEAAFHIQFRDLRRDIGPILGMAVPGVILSTGLIGFVLSALDVLPLQQALLFGALISATDPVAVVATFRALGAPRRLTTLIEGESLFNDGTAIVIFGIVLELVRTGALSPVDGALSFLRVSVGGLMVGFVLGYVAAELIARIDDYLIETTLTTVLAYGAYIIAEGFHVSGVLAVVMAGLVNGNMGSRGMSPTTRLVLFNFWEYIAFLANSFVFLLIGMNVRWDDLLQYLQVVLITVVVVLAVRFITVHVLGAVTRLFKRDLSFSYLPVMVWGGLRGAVSLALVLGLPRYVPDQTQLRAMTFGVVLFTLLAQATTISVLLRRLGFIGKTRRSEAYERLQGELLALRAARRHISHLHDEGALIPRAWATVREELEDREEQILAEIDDLLVQHPQLREEIVTLAHQEALRAQRAALADLAREGLLSREVMNELQSEVDRALEEGPSYEPEDESLAEQAPQAEV